MPKKSPLDAIISAAEAAAILGCTVDYVSHLCRTGKLEAKRLGRDWAILLSSLTALQRDDGTPGRPRSRQP